MTHRKSVVFLEVGANKDAQRIDVGRATFHLSSVPQNYDDIVGANLKSIFATIDSTDFSLQSIMTEPPFMMEQQPTPALENNLKKLEFIMLLSDEYGSFQGVITLTIF
jgi:putative hemolysin